MNAKGNKYPAYAKLCIVSTPEVVKVSKLIQLKIGQGEGDTKWKGWPWNALLLMFDIKINYLNKTLRKKNKVVP